MLNDDLRGRMLAQVFWTELEKIAETPVESSIDENKNLNEMKFKEVDREQEEEEEEEEEDDKDSILGTSFLKKEKEKYQAKGLPILKDRSGEGLRFDPNMQSYVPDFDAKAQEISQSAKQQGIMEGKVQGVTESLNKIRKSREEKAIVEQNQAQAQDQEIRNKTDIAQQNQAETQEVRNKINLIQQNRQKTSEIRQKIDQMKAQKQQQFNQ